MTKNEDGFTLIEMLIVLMIITVLILLIIPNLTDKTKSVHEDGCTALQKTVQAQVEAYTLDKGKAPSSIEELEKEDYIEKDQQRCANSDQEFELKNGKVTLPK
ncbi:MAG TPA: competence type IV pilus major pilin ComGC [Pseudogracilibacillus sp.]|nr:competence type IV pilus major pilin ComGC [Pseudogracilibacillus sp.]